MMTRVGAFPEVRSCRSHGHTGAFCRFLLGGVVFLYAVLPGRALAVEGVSLSSSINGRRLAESTQVRPIRLEPNRPSTVTVEVVNDADAELEIRTVRLEGRVIGLTFFAFDHAVLLKVPPDSRQDLTFESDLGGLRGQATGLIPGTIKVLDREREIVAEDRGVMDVRGSIRSVYGLFGLGVALLTAQSLVFALVSLARRRLPRNRARRGLMFMTPGIGLGLLVNFTLSATRVYVPEVARSIAIVLVCAAVMFGLGYLTPGGGAAEDDLELEEEVSATAQPS